MVKQKITYLIGLPEACRPYVAELVETAFGMKYMAMIPRHDHREILLGECLQLDRVAGAFIGNRLVGYAGFSLKGRGYMGRFAPDQFIEHQGLFAGGLNATMFGFNNAMQELSYLFEGGVNELVGKKQSDLFGLSGLVVAPEMRGQKIGTGLLHLMFTHAREHQCKMMRLHVLKSNRRARKLYERMGFHTHDPHLFASLGSLITQFDEMEKKL